MANYLLLEINTCIATYEHDFIWVDGYVNI